MSGTGNTTRSFVLTENILLDGLLRGIAWADTTLYYSFPVSGDEYGYTDQPESFSPISLAQMEVAQFALDADLGSPASAGFSVEGFTNLNVEFSDDPNVAAHLRFGESDSPDTAEAYYPGTYAQAGDVWFGTTFNYRDAELGAYSGWTVLHEIGHALGLKHPHEAEYGFPALPEEYDALEMSAMSYRSFFGRDPDAGLTNQFGNLGQSFMLLDIAALQELYGANYSINSDDTVYSWLPGNGDTLVNGEIGIDQVDSVNKIFATIWDGGGIDTYDLSAYETDLTINLMPGASSVFSTAQIANLGLGNSAAGNIYNALLHNDDTRSLIENAIGGSGNDTLIGNQAINMLDGGDGFDTADYSDQSYHALTQQDDGSFLGDFGSLGDTLLNIERIVGALGTDIITIASSSDGFINNNDVHLELQSGNDTLTVLGGDVMASLGSGADSLSISSAAAWIEIVDAASEDFGSFFDLDTGEQFDIGYDFSVIPASSTGSTTEGNLLLNWVTEDNILYSFDAIAAKVVVVFESASLVLSNFVNGALGIVLGDEGSGTSNQIIATNQRDILTGTDEADSFVFAAGTSTTSTIDIVRDWTPDDTIDLSALNLTADDLELRTISGGATLKLIEGFGSDDFQLRVDLNSYSVDQVLASIIFENGPTIPTNTAPTANDDIAETEANQAIGISVLNNDTDLEGDILTVDAFSQGENGSVTDLGNGVLRYTPDPDFFGSDSFTYTISDEDGLESTATVTVEVAEPRALNVITGTDNGETLSGTDQDDEIFGLDGDDFLYGNGGDDILRGGDGRDSLIGGNGDDTLIGGGNSQGSYGDYLYLDAGNDSLFGSADLLDSIVAEAPVGLSVTSTQFHIDLSQNLIIKDGFGGTDRVENVEDIFLYNVGDDIIIGDDTNNFIISYYGGADIYSGLGGNDTFDLDYAVQSIDGGEGNDRLMFSNIVLDRATGLEVDRPSGVHVDLGAGLIVDDGFGGQTSLQSIEWFQGTSFNDRLIGDENDNLISSIGGDDFIDAAGGDDQIILKDGNSEALGGAGDDLFFIDAVVGDVVIAGEEGSDQYVLGETATTLRFRLGDGEDTLFSFDASYVTIDVSDFGITATQALTLAEQVGSDTLISFGAGDSLRIISFDPTQLSEANFIGGTPKPPLDFNIVAANVGRETLRGTDEADAFTFAEGTSINGAIDIVSDWAPGDVIDLSGLGLTADDFEVRTVSGGTVVKLIEGFGAGEFHVRINLNGYSQEEVLASVIYDAAPPPPPVNTAPTANDDSAETEANSRLLIDVLANDTDPENDLLSVDNFDQGANGTVTDLGNGILEYTPNQDFTGSDSFSYTISDEAGLKSTATVTVEVTASAELNVIIGTEENDILYGTNANDEIIGLDGNDQIHGEDGDDTLRGGDGRDSLYGGNGDDVLIGGGNPSNFNGDFFHVDAGNDTLIGNDETRDVLIAGSLENFITNQIHIDLSLGLVVSDGFGGTDSVTGIPSVRIYGLGADLVIGDNNDNSILSELGGGDIFEGNGGNDNFQVSYAPFSVDGGDGTDILRFQDLVYDSASGSFVARPGGVHIDLVIGQVVNDGFDEQTQLTGIENIQGTRYSDRLIGNDENNDIYASGDDDFVDAKGGDDYVVTGLGNNTVFGGDGNDRILIGPGDNIVFGDDGDDFLSSESGANGSLQVFGGRGDDTLELGNTLTTIGFSRGDDNDTISNSFNAFSVTIDVTGLDISAAAALDLAQQIGADTLIDFGEGDSITIQNFSAATLTETNFVGIDLDPPGDYNIVNANVGQENINGTDAADAFTFAEGTSVNGAIDTILDWAPGDVIDLSQLGVTADDIEVRSISGGSTLKLIEGFGAGEFHVKINLNGNSQEDVLSSVIFEANESVSSVIADAFTALAPEQASINDDMPLSSPSNGPVSGPPSTMIGADQPEDLIGIDTPDWDFG
ncbi:MAG: Ig-like domain-containing protein [Henriciella sp.]